MVKAKGVKKFLLEIPEEIWEKWKDTIPRSISLNEALIKLLKREANASPLPKRGQREEGKK